VSTFRKTVYQILKYLKYLKVEWTDVIKLPPEPAYIPKYIPKEDIDKTFEYFKNHKHFLRFKAVILLGISSGIRAEELYQLNINDFDLGNRIVRINHNPKNGQTTKTRKSRISFFTEDTKQALIEYFNYFNNGSELKVLFPQIWLERKFRNAPIKVKQLRKFFSQQWERRGGSTGIKKILMGHSLKGDVDLQHYNCQSEDDLKKIYDRVMVE
jgi:integrase/recombinase XerD